MSHNNSLKIKRKIPNKGIILISPHPDDMEIGMGGTVAKLKKMGADILSIVITDGRRSPRSFKCSNQKMAKIRRQETTKAALSLGIRAPIFLSLPDIRSPENQQKAKKKLMELIIQTTPIEIYFPHPHFDRHPTHRICSELVLEVANSLAKNNLMPPLKFWTYEVWGLFPYWNRLEDITDFYKAKIEAIKKHKSQIHDMPYVDAVLGLNRWRAVFEDPDQIPNKKYAEAFLGFQLNNRKLNGFERRNYKAKQKK